MAMQVCSPKSVDANVLFVDGWQRVIHTPLRCRSMDCRLSGRYVWHNYWSESEAGTERHYWSGPAIEEMQHFFCAAAWGVSTAWLRQFAQRLVRHFASVTGEAAVHRAAAHRAGRLADVPEGARRI